MLKDVKGIGVKNLELLKKLNINTVQDLLEFYPFRYNHIAITPLKDGDVCICGIVETMPIATYIRKNFNKMSFRMQVDNYLVNVTIFNRAFMKNALTRGKTITVIGEYDSKSNTISASDIRLKEIKGSTLEPVYHQVSGLSSKVINNFINSALDSNPEIIDYIPDYLVEKYDFIDKMPAIREIHNPKSTTSIKDATIRLKYEELFRFMFKINYLKSNRTDKGGLKRDVPVEKAYEFIDDLPFKLTKDQLSSIKDILNDLILPKRMNRLLLGDVGSGKTIVAIVAIYYNYLNGYQSAMLAPTEILATQHFLNISKMFNKYGIRVEILKGGTNKKERAKILEDLANGDIDVLIGTHAVLQDDVEFKNLGLVVTDEQHRFGVNQRKVFQNKGTMSDVLYMSATPIPRTYALTIYGDMDISLIKTKPSGRKEVKTSLVSSKDIKKVLYAMLDEIKEGHQVYVICPMIETDDESDLEDVNKLKRELDVAFNKKIPIGVLHGKLKNKDKEKVMDDFKEGKTKILISTTVIEVGVDVENATMMVIFNAERFGLATLHQLRGRIGRNSLESKCILISDKPSKRLDVLVESSDGFYISEMDFKLRGEGDLFGTQQSGDMVFKIASLNTDMKILTQANIDSKKFIDDNKEDDFDSYPMYKDVVSSLNHID